MNYIKFFEEYNFVKENPDYDPFVFEVTKFMMKHKVRNFSINNGVVDIDGDIIITHYNLDGIPFKIGKVTGNCILDYNNLTSLKNCPEYVGGDFSCGNNNLSSLEGIPKYVGGSLYLHSNFLTDLDFMPNTVGGSILLNSNRLTTLKGLPEYVSGNLDLDSNELNDIVGSPKVINGNFNINFNDVTSLNGGPKKVGGLRCIKTMIKDFKGCPVVSDEIISTFCSDLKSLDGIYSKCSSYNLGSLHNTDLPYEITSLFPDENNELLYYIIQNQEEYGIWNNDGTLNVKRFYMMLNER